MACTHGTIVPPTGTRTRRHPPMPVFLRCPGDPAHVETSCLDADRCTGPVPTLAQAQAPLRIVVGSPPGGSSDRVARIVADNLGAKLGIAVLVENKTGAGG